MIQYSNKIIFFIVLFSLNVFSISAQDSIVPKPRKNIVTFNFLYAFTTPANPAFAYERSLNKHLSIHTMLSIGFPPYSDRFSEKQNACIRIVPELRYYLSNNPNRPLMAGFYSGVFLYYQYQKLSSPEYNYRPDNAIPIYTTNAEWQYNYFGGGISLGYQLHVLKSKRLIFDFNTGLQYSTIKYTSNAVDGGTFDGNFKYTRFCSDVLGEKNFSNYKYQAWDPRIWLSIGYSF